MVNCKIEGGYHTNSRRYLCPTASIMVLEVRAETEFAPFAGSLISNRLRGAYGKAHTGAPDYEPLSLPEVRLTSDVSLEETLLQRRSVREYTGEALSLEEVSQLLWAALGITVAWGGRTASSAGALYPLYVIPVGRKGQVCSYCSRPSSLWTPQYGWS